jgi:hypothetical protein
MKDLNIKVHLCTHAEMQEEVDKAGIRRWYGNHLRGFCYPSKQEIFIVEDCFGELALLAHEYGHLRGLKHTKFPSIMNFSGLFRIFAFHPSDFTKFLKATYLYISKIISKN